ncbi:hypothetical protein [Bartonella sp. CL74QHWL]|uniref:hypothetical protein n=1 Tax=Bartonella sp. CL74QHWL TaxID=3243541 RepID=UPI0035CEBF1F
MFPNPLHAYYTPITRLLHAYYTAYYTPITRPLHGLLHAHYTAYYTPITRPITTPITRPITRPLHGGDSEWYNDKFIEYLIFCFIKEQASAIIFANLWVL